MIESENYMYKKDYKIEQMIEIIADKNYYLNEVKEQLRNACEDFEEIMNQRNILLNKIHKTFIPIIVVKSFKLAFIIELLKLQEKQRVTLQLILPR